EPPASEETAALCASLLEVTFNQLIAPKHGAHWKLERSECDALGKAYGAVLDKYFPNLRTGPEAAAILPSADVRGPSIAQSAQLRAQEQEANPDGSREQRASIRRPPPVPVAGGEFRTGGASE